jgi:ubiquinone biosynthesis protein COQ4
MTFFERLQFAKAFFALVESPTTTENVFKIGSIGMRYPDSPGAKAMLDHVFSNEEFKRQFEEQYFPTYADLDELAKLPERTLGKEFSLHMQKNKLKIDFFPQEDLAKPMKYTVMRLRYCHDIWHVLAGYDTSPLGELALQAFALAQARTAIGWILLGAGFLYKVRHPGLDAVEFMELISTAFQRGKKAQFLLSLKYDDLWAIPLDELRGRLGIVNSAVAKS